MPKVIGYTPPYLSRPSPGYKIFTDPAPQSPVSPSKRSSHLGPPPPTTYVGPRRLVASRGTEIFTVVGNKIRWADLAVVKDEWEEGTQSGTTRFGQSRGVVPPSTEENVYRTLDVPVYYQIRQLVISPSGFFLAVCTEHTVHIAVLPPSSRLRDQDRSPLKLKTYHLGPTIHVIPESPLASVLWHPLAVATASADCIVTVTTEAAVRVWEFDKSNTWSFERPKLAIDLRKLADGVSCEQDFEPSGFGKTRGFSADEFDMEASAACFGGRGRDDEDAWSSMTLWTAMRNGDIYALCPLLPSKWKPTATTIPSLTTNAVSRMASIPAEDAGLEERRAADQQYEWVQEIDNEEPQIQQSTDTLGEYEVRLRPQNPSAIPRLQGPYAITPEDDGTEIEISDIYVFPARLDEDEFFDDEDDEDHLSPGISTPVPFSTICVATTENELWFGIDLDGVSGQWLPKKGRTAFDVPSSDARALTLIDTFVLKSSDAETAASWPIFTPDVVPNYTVFLTTAKHVHSFSLSDWITNLAAELLGTDPIDPGLRTRLETSCQSQVCIVDDLVGTREASEALSAPTIIDDTTLGYLLLTTTANAPYAVLFDQMHSDTSRLPASSPELTTTSFSIPESQLAKAPDVETLPSRDIYRPPNAFYNNQLAPIENMRQRLTPALKAAIAERPLKQSPAILSVVTHAHRTIGSQTAEVEKGAAELFRRCERLKEELENQVTQMVELAQQLQRLKTSGEVDESGRPKEKKSPDVRIKEARERQAKLVARYEALRRKVGRLGSRKRELTTKEMAWMEEIEALGRTIGVVDGEDGVDEKSRLDKRFETVKKYTRDLVDDARRLEKQQQPSQPPPPPLESSVSWMSSSSITPSMSASQALSRTSASPSTSGFMPLGVSSRLQKERIADIMATVEREGAVIEAAMKRLDTLRAEY